MTPAAGYRARCGRCPGLRRPVPAWAGRADPALSILSTTFSDPKERGKAFGVYGAIVGAGGAIGLVLGGILLTEYLSWRWCLYVNLIFAGLVAMGAVLLLKHQRARTRTRLDLPGAALVSASMFCLVYGFSNAAAHNWHTPSTYGFLAAGVALLAVFALWQSRAASPLLLPPRVVLDRNRGGAYLAVLTAGVGMFGIFLFLTYYLQQTLGCSPVVSGVAFLPLIAMVVVAANLSNVVLLPRLGPKPLVTAGMLLAAGSLVWLTRIGVHSSYASAVLGPLMAAGLGLGFTIAVDEHRDVPRGAAGRGRGLRHAQHRPADRRLDRHLPAQHDLRQRGGALPDQPPEPRHPGPRAPGAGPDRDVADSRLHHRVLGRGGHLRRRRGDLRHAVRLRPAPRLRGHDGRGSRAAGHHRTRRVAA
jgi:MFS family permease